MGCAAAVGLCSLNKQTEDFPAQSSGISHLVQKLPPPWQLSPRKLLYQLFSNFTGVKCFCCCRKDLKSVKPDLGLSLSSGPPPINLLHLQAGSSRCCNLCWGDSNCHNNCSSNVLIPSSLLLHYLLVFVSKYLTPHPPSREIGCPAHMFRYQILTDQRTLWFPCYIYIKFYKFIN